MWLTTFSRSSDSEDQKGTTTRRSSSTRRELEPDRDTLLTDELVRRILAYVPPDELLNAVSLTSTRWARLVRDDSFWRYDMESSAKLLISTAPHREDDSLISPKGQHVFTKHQLQRYALYRAATSKHSHHAHEQLHTLHWLQYGSVLTARREANLVLAQRRNRTTCLASTTDRPKETITNVLRSSENVRRYGSMFGWWSSRPTALPDQRTETLLLATQAPVSLLNTVHIKPLLDPYVGHVVYHWKHTRISAYLLPHDETKLAHGYPCTFAASHPNHQNTWTTVTAEADNQAVIDRLLEHQTPVFTQTWPVDRPDCSDTLMFDLNPKGDKPVVANVIAIELIGKHVEQMPGSGYYACVEQLDCQGIPLYHSLADVRRANSASWASVLWDPR